MGISITGNNEIRLLTFMFKIKRKKWKKHQYYCYKTNKQKWHINNRLQLEVAYMFNEQFTYLTRTVFGNPTLLLRALIPSRDLDFFFLLFKLCPIVLNLLKMPFQCHTFWYMVCCGYI